MIDQELRSDAADVKTSQLVEQLSMKHNSTEQNVQQESEVINPPTVPDDNLGVAVSEASRKGLPIAITPKSNAGTPRNKAAPVQSMKLLPNDTSLPEVGEDTNGSECKKDETSVSRTPKSGKSARVVPQNTWSENGELPKTPRLTKLVNTPRAQSIQNLFVDE